MKKEVIIVENFRKIKTEMSLEECINYFSKSVRAWAISCYSSANKLSHNVMEVDDFYNEGMMCLINVYEKYVPRNTFSTNLHKSLDNLKIDLFRKANAKKRKSTKKTISLDGAYANDIMFRNTIGREDEELALVELNLAILNMLNKLTEEEKRIFTFLYDKNITKKILSEELKITRPTLDSRIDKVKLKVIKLMPEYFSVV